MGSTLTIGVTIFVFGVRLSTEEITSTTGTLEITEDITTLLVLFVIGVDIAVDVKSTVAIGLTMGVLTITTGVVVIVGNIVASAVTIGFIDMLGVVVAFDI